MEEKDYELSFSIISFAGNANSLAMMAIESAREGKLEEARKQIEEAQSNLHEAHEIQTDMITEEARGNLIHVNIILVHAQDHLAMANMALENAKEFIHLYEIVFKMQKERELY